MTYEKAEEDIYDFDFDFDDFKRRKRDVGNDLKVNLFLKSHLNEKKSHFRKETRPTLSDWTDYCPVQHCLWWMTLVFLLEIPAITNPKVGQHPTNAKQRLDQHSSDKAKKRSQSFPI